MEPKISPVIKTQKGGKTIYTWEGKTLRTSVRDYKYVLFGLSHERYNPEKSRWEGNPAGAWVCIGFGNNAQRLFSSWKGITFYDKYEVVEIQ